MQALLALDSEAKARSRIRSAICNQMRPAQISLSLEGGFCPITAIPA